MQGGNGTDYEVIIDTFKPILPGDEESKWVKTGRSIAMQIMKKDQEEEEHWPRITKEKAKLQWLQVDWSKFVDEDEEDGADEVGGFEGGQGFGGGGMGGPGGMDMASLMAGMGGGAGGAGGMDMASMMQGMEGMGGDGGADDVDSDDELPDLDDADGDADDVD